MNLHRCVSKLLLVFIWSGIGIVANFASGHPPGSSVFFSDLPFRAVRSNGNTFANNNSDDASISEPSTANSTVLHGIDVSDYQGSINWSQVATAGKTFAFVKATSGLNGNQSNFSQNMQGANAAGIKSGAYHFAYPNYTSANTGSAEAQHFINVAAPYLVSGYLRPVLDVEDVPSMNSYPGQQLGKAGLSQWIRDFSGVIKNQYGIDIIIYCTRDYARNYLEADLSAHAYWVPTNDDNESGTPSGMGIWNTSWAFKQYLFGTDANGNVTATCPGVPGGCDLDSFPGSTSDLNTYLIGQSVTSSIASVIPSPSSNTVATVGQTLNVQVQVAGTATGAGYLQVWLYDSTFSFSQKVGTYIGGPQSYNVNLSGFSLTNSSPATQSYAIFTQFRPGATSGPLSSNQVGDIQSSQTYTINWQNPTAAQTVTTPTITSGGTYVGSVQVTLYCSTFGSTIYYTTDGSTPTTNSTVYSSPFSLTKSTTVKAVAVEIGYNNSTVVSSTYTINPSSAGAVLSLSTNQFNNLGAGNGGGSFLIYDSGVGTLSWTASTSTPWISIPTSSGTAGSQGAFFQFSVEQNTGSTARTGTITISAPGAAGSPQVVTIKQYQSNAPVAIANVAANPATGLPGQNITVSCSVTPVEAQYVLFGVSLYPTGQTSVRFDDPADDVAITIAPGTQTISRTFKVPANAPGGLYDVEVGIWADNNGNGVIDGGDTLLGEQKSTQVLNVTAPPTPSYAITTSASPNGAGATVGGGTFASGSAVAVTATSNSGYSFAYWAENGIQVSTDGTYTFTATSDRTLIANFVASPISAPQITSSMTASGSVNTPFTYNVTASNNPTSFGASGLPSGLNITATTGLISGSPTQNGVFTVGLTATNGGGVGAATLTLTVSGSTHASFFASEAALSNGVFYLTFPNGNYFGYYSYLTDPHYIFHFDMGYEYCFDAADSHAGVYFYDFKSNTFFYTSPTFPFPYLYDFTLNTVLYYYPDPNNAGRYNTNGVRYFYRFDNGQIFTK